jgi:glycosidase
MAPPLYPALYEINTRVWLRELSRGPARPATFDDVPDEALDRIAGLGFDWVWLLGVWQTGPAGREVSRTNPDLRREYPLILPDLTEDDISGSPFAIRDYAVHSDFGGDGALARLRARLGRRGVRLMLDFVPNHTGPDHRWAWEHPEYYVHGGEEDLAREPGNFCRVETARGPAVLARGRDPYFPGWPDTLQLNYRHAGFREAMKGQLGRIADACDGLRCDMAMLVLPDVFAGTWGDRSRSADGSPPEDLTFWPEAIAHVRERHPEFLFMAEAYWDLEWTLQQLGFDQTYDKRLYDRLRARDTTATRGHLHAHHEFQVRSTRFLENHDEPRAAAEFPPDVHQAAAVVTFLVPGLRFFHEGQLEGREVKLSVHLGRRPDESVDLDLRDFYLRLLEVLRRPEVRGGRWCLLDCWQAWDGNYSNYNYIAFGWEGDDGRRLLVAVNYGSTRAQCLVGLPWADLSGRTVALRDLMSPTRYDRNGDELTGRGLYLDMPAWAYHVFEVGEP